MRDLRAAPRDEIDASWRRSEDAGLTRDRFEPPHTDDVEDGGLLARAARPVLDQLVDDLGLSSISVVLTDEHGHLVDRHVTDRSLRVRLDRISLAPGFVYSEAAVGTNAIGTALEQRTPSFVRGDEHFAEALIRMACAAAPIADPRSGRVLGVVDLSCGANDASSLMLPLATRTAREIEQRLVDDTRVAERVVLQRFLRARRGAKGPIVFVNERTMITNAAADRLVDPTDETALWECARRFLAGGQAQGSGLVLGGGASVAVRFEAVTDGGAVLGVILRLGPMPDDRVHEREWVRRPFGWDSLTATELSVTALVAEGLTNAQAAERLFVSRYTVDFHLRSVFRKLDVRSRVDLTRIAVGRDSAPADSA